MKRLIAIFAASTFFQVSSVYLPGSGGFAEEPPLKITGRKILKRIDFSDSYITGQSVKAGAVYIFQRKQGKIKGMLGYRKHYRREILEGFSIPKRGHASQHNQAQKK